MIANIFIFITPSSTYFQYYKDFLLMIKLVEWF